MYHKLTNKQLFTKSSRQDKHMCFETHPIDIEYIHIATTVVSSNPARGEMYSTILWDKFCPWLTAGRRISPRTQVSSTNKTERQDIAKILLKVALNSITVTLY